MIAGAQQSQTIRGFIGHLVGLPLETIGVDDVDLVLLCIAAHHAFLTPYLQISVTQSDIDMRAIRHSDHDSELNSDEANAHSWGWPDRSCREPEHEASDYAELLGRRTGR